MTRGLLAPLSPQEEITLRRIAHGSLVVDPQATARLASLALVEHIHTSLRLTPLGRLRFNALPKAPLLTRQHSAQASSDYVAGVIEKAQGMAKAQAAQLASAQPAAVDDEDDLPGQPIDWFFDRPHWKSCAERNIEKIRVGIMEHRRRQEQLCDDSHRRIVMSRSLLKTTIPVTPAWLGALR